MRPTWACGISLKRAQKMQLRNVDLRSVGHSHQKLSPKIDFWDFQHAYLLEHLTNFHSWKLNRIEKSKWWINYKHKKTQKKPAEVFWRIYLEQFNHMATILQCRKSNLCTFFKTKTLILLVFSPYFACIFAVFCLYFC